MEVKVAMKGACVSMMNARLEEILCGQTVPTVWCLGLRAHETVCARACVRVYGGGGGSGPGRAAATQARPAVGICRSVGAATARNLTPTTGRAIRSKSRYTGALRSVLRVPVRPPLHGHMTYTTRYWGAPLYSGRTQRDSAGGQRMCDRHSRGPDAADQCERHVAIRHGVGCCSCVTQRRLRRSSSRSPRCKSTT